MTADVLVIGGGMAGVFAAMKANEQGASVALVDKGYMSRSGASSANDGHYTVYHKEWGADLKKWQDEVAQTGEYMNNPAATEATLLESYERLMDLDAWGLNLKRDANGEIEHHGSWGGAPYQAVALGWGWHNFGTLRKTLIKNGIRIFDRIYITDLMNQEGDVSGAVGFHAITGDFYIFNAKATVICTGTSGFKGQAPGCFHRASFDGEALVYRAGGACSGMEFVGMGSRFSPYTGTWPEGSVTHDREGAEVDNTFFRYAPFLYGQPHPTMILGDLTDADGHGDGVFYPYSASKVHEGKGPLLLDTRRVTDEQIAWSKTVYDEQEVLNRMNEVVAEPVYLKRGLFSGDFHMSETFMGRHMGGSGGITATDLFGSTTLPGLFSGGDSYHSGATGSTYPSGGTGLRVAATTGARAGISAGKYAKERRNVRNDRKQIDRFKEYAYEPIMRKGGFDPMWVGEQIRSLVLPYYTLAIRKGDRLQAGITTLDFLGGHVGPRMYARDIHKLCHCHEAKNRIIGARMIMASALFREESRGLHYREDFPNRDEANWHASIVIRNVNGRMVCSKEPIDQYWPGLRNRSYLEKYTKRYLGEVIPEESQK